MPLDRILLGGSVTLPLSGDNMEENGTLYPPDVLKSFFEGGKVVPVHNAYVVEAKLFEDYPRRDEPLEKLLRQLHESEGGLTEVSEELLDPLARFLNKVSAYYPVQIGGEGAHVRRYGHLVVVEDYDEAVGSQVSCVVEGFESHPRRHGTVPYDRDNEPLLSLHVLGYPESEGCGYGGGAVPRPEGVENALIPPEKARHAPVLPEGVKAILSIGQDLPGVSLMSYIPHDRIPGG